MKMEAELTQSQREAREEEEKQRKDAIAKEKQQQLELDYERLMKKSTFGDIHLIKKDSDTQKRTKPWERNQKHLYGEKKAGAIEYAKELKENPEKAAVALKEAFKA